MNLDKLLADALRHAGKNEALKQALECALIHREVQNRYGPKTWRTARLIELVWSPAPGSGQTQSLGLFREMVHTPSDARRLVRLDSPPPAEEVSTEFCYGEHWIEARKPVERTPRVEEILELRERFEDLMQEFEQGEKP